MTLILVDLGNDPVCMFVQIKESNLYKGITFSKSNTVIRIAFLFWELIFLRGQSTRTNLDTNFCRTHWLVLLIIVWEGMQKHQLRFSFIQVHFEEGIFKGYYHYKSIPVWLYTKWCSLCSNWIRVAQPQVCFDRDDNAP